MLHPCRKPLLSIILIIMGASIFIRNGSAVSLRGRELEMKCTCDSPCGNPCENPSLPPPSMPPPSPPLLPPPLPPPPSPPLPPPYWPTSPSPPFCPPPPYAPAPPYTPGPPYWFSPPGILYPVDPGYHTHDGAGRSSTGWLPVLVGCGLLALWL